MFQRRTMLIHIVIFFLVSVEGKSKLGTKIELHDENGLIGDAAYYNLPVINKRQAISTGLRPGQATSTHSCNRARGVPSELRSSSVMRPRGIDSFYQKYTEAYGIPILSSANVPDDALKRACYITRFLFADNAAVRNSFYKRSGRTAVIGAQEGTTDIPEHSFLSDWWNDRARGLGATDSAPVSSGGEENLLCYKNDRYRNEDIFLHEFAHGVHNLGAKYAINGWDQRLVNQYSKAKQAGLWANTYSMSSAQEYFAEGVQSFFHANDYSNPPNGIHGTIDTREKLKDYDPVLYGLIEEVFPCKNQYLKRCDSSREKEANQNLKMNCAGDGGTTGGSVTGGGETTGSDCKDNNRNCKYWASRNYCSRSPGYMLTNCKESCNKCSETGRPTCVDNNNYCQSWAQNGECTKNPGYMLQNCKKSCNSC